MNKMMKVGASVAALVLAGATGIVMRGRSETLSTAASAGAKSANDGLIAAPGRVEAISEEVRVSSELSGRLKSVSVEEGDRVKRGQILAELENADYRARVESAEAELVQREAELRRTVNGSRTEERREAEAAKHAAKAVLENAKNEAERRRGLAERNVI